WYRQLDIVRNKPLYRPTLSAASYRQWLRRMGVDYVVAPLRTTLAPMGADREQDLLLSGRSGLVVVYRNRDVVVLRLPHAVPILTGPGRPRMTFLGHDRIEFRLTRPGVYSLRIWYTPYWHLRGTGLCIRRSRDQTTQVVSGRAGRFVLTVPSALSALVGGK